MAKLALGVGEVDNYSAEKLERIKRKFPELTFNSYLTLSKYGISDLQIIGMYGIKRTMWFYFKSNHMRVLKEIRQWD